MKREKRALWIIGILFLAVGMVVIVLRGPSYTIRYPAAASADDADQYQVQIDQDREIIELTDKHLENGILSLTIQSVSRGRAYLDVIGPDGPEYMVSVHVHHFGIITIDNFLGKSSGAGIIPVLASLYMLLVLWYVVVQYRRDRRESLYQYRNIRNLGWIIFLSMMLVGQIPYLLSGDSLVGTVSRMLDSASSAAFIAFPVAFILSVLVAISNIQLMRREGRNWRNMLGLILGLLLCLSTIFPSVLSELLQRTTIVDVHNERGIALYVEMAVTNGILIVVSYLECILWGTIILSVIAAKKTPAFDKDYILILGCQIRSDGTLTPLLKGRADRAMEFARMQKEATGKDITFVPSGGKGFDEIMAEGQAIRNYLVSTGIPDGRILVEDQSVNTDGNFKQSMALIEKESCVSEPKIAFSTTNYHVFRSGILARQQGIHAEGIGSKTRSYFWVNAFVREFIATMYAERKKHLKVIAALVLLTLAMVYIVRLSSIL